MSEYRVYRLAADGHIVSPPDIMDCRNDAEAIKRAHALSNGKDLEIWQGDRRVALLKAAPT